MSRTSSLLSSLHWNHPVGWYGRQTDPTDGRQKKPLQCQCSFNAAVQDNRVGGPLYGFAVLSHCVVRYCVRIPCQREVDVILLPEI